MNKDIIIIGAGPAGLTSAIYSSRAMLSTLVIEKQAIGGQMVFTTEVENYPGFPEGVFGAELGALMEKQAKRFGTEIVYETVQKIDFENKKILTESNEYYCKALILCLGASPMKLNLEKEKELTGRGISYCATCDGAFFRDLEVAVVGGGNTAIEDALFLTNFASKVYIIHRRDKLRAEKYLQEKAFKNQKIEFLWNSEVVKLNGDESLESVIVKNKITLSESLLNVKGLFVFVGYQPQTSIVKDALKLDNAGYIEVNSFNQTNIEWVFSAGDCVKKPYKQIATAIGDGCTAAISALNYIENLK